MPQSLDSIRAEEEASHREYEARTVGARLADGREVKIEELRAAFDLLNLGADWKRGFSVLVPSDWAELIQEAVGFFHGARPHVIRVGNGSNLLRITGDGYIG